MFALRRISAPAARQAWSKTVATTQFASVRALSTNYYSKDHEWLEVDGTTARVGITEFAQDALGDLVYVELPEVGDEFEIGDSFASVESVKAASDVYSPCDGVVVAINEELADDPALVNADAEGRGWLVEFKLQSDDSIADNLISRADYDEFCKSEGDH